MSQQGQWQVAGSAPEVYERELVPAVFGVWAPILVELAHNKELTCLGCGGPLHSRDGKYALKYFRVGSGSLRDRRH